MPPDSCYPARLFKCFEVVDLLLGLAFFKGKFTYVELTSHLYQAASLATDVF
jgi:hypothetical protein